MSPDARRRRVGQWAGAVLAASLAVALVVKGLAGFGWNTVALIALVLCTATCAISAVVSNQSLRHVERARDEALERRRQRLSS